MQIIKRNILLIMMLLITIVTMQSCSKSDLSNPNNVVYNAPDTLLNGTIKFTGTNHTVTQNGLTINYISSSPCYPSNEIFFFTAIPQGIDTSNVTYSWYIQDGQNHSILMGKKVQYFFNNSGSYYIKLQAISGNNIIATCTTNVTAFGQRANNRDVGFLINYSSTTNKQYLAFSSTAQNPLDGYINALYWDFGDGTIDGSNNTYPNHTFPAIPADMNYAVKLYVNNNANCKDSAIHTVLIPASYSLPCAFTFSSANACTTGEIFTFKADTTGVPTGASYIWDFKDYSNGFSGNPVTHQYAYPNRYDVTMKIMYKGVQLCSHYDTTVFAKGQNAKPYAYFYSTPESGDSTKWFFNDLSSFNNGGYLGDIVWDFGDGHTAHPNQYSPSLDYTYSVPTTTQHYTVKMVITSNLGCKDSTYQNVTVPGH